jgi:hypothetical protein
MNILLKIQSFLENFQTATSEKIYLTGLSGSFTSLVVSFNFDIGYIFKILTALGGFALTLLSIYLQVQQVKKNKLEIRQLELQTQLTEWQMRQTNDHFPKQPFDADILDNEKN